jgi:hypothetical protein
VRPRVSPQRLSIVLAVAAAALGALVAVHYHRAGLTLAHYDARGHLIVARRIIDSITPGWQQIGAVWLPLPHLLNAIPVQVDLFYRTGASGIVISIAAFAVATGSIGWMVLALTGSVSAAVAGAAVFALNPNVLYLQATPMTEPLLLALTTLAVAMLMAWCHEKSTSYFVLRTSHVGVVFALACLTRYEAWPVTVSALAAAVWVRSRRREPLRDSCREVGAIALYPAIAIAAFAVFSRVVIGDWLLAGGFFVPENKALGAPMVAASEIAWGTRALSGAALVWIAVAGAAVLVVWSLTRTRAAALLPLSLLAAAAIPFSAFVDGHPFRIRYMVPLLACQAIGAGVLAGAIPRARLAGALLLAALIAYDLRPLDLSAPMVVEAQWDRPNGPERARVTACLDQPHSPAKIMASMGSLGHYMQEASRSGFALRDFLHEGNGDIWLAALDGPRPFAGWIMIEEKAEGGDMLAKLSRARPSFLDGYARVCEGAGLALYKRRDHG